MVCEPGNHVTVVFVELVVLLNVTVELLPPQPIVLFVEIAVMLAIGGTVFWYTVKVFAELVEVVTHPVKVLVTVIVYIPAEVNVASLIELDVTPLGNQV